jgi:hypothetical protein
MSGTKTWCSEMVQSLSKMLRNEIDLNTLHSKADQFRDMAFAPFTLAEVSYPKDRNFDILSFYEESKLANDLAYISSTGLAPGNVTAAAVEVFNDNSPMVIKIAANEKIPSRTKEGLQIIISILRKVARQGTFYI